MAKKVFQIQKKAIQVKIFLKTLVFKKQKNVYLQQNN